MKIILLVVLILLSGSCASSVPKKVNYNVKADQSGEIEEQSIQATWEF